MAVFLSTLLGSVVKAIIFGILALIGIKLGKKVRDIRRGK
ncbi:hypothetical protein HMPREF9970_0656 [Lachnoanaerobaculum saburreum F0468]|jgi:hypothetical protein|uniref:Uncharacterized protein n=2 Tax=Lachnoanaerobaculum saburreum TaxID=467210 RepID=I0RBP0_9FIRM|nr:hypothetical protein HMPREF0381_1870 [Lachnoanaerobaculum saburreum DSM 3986]EIC97098.1 hypothetical protein HMPREF9970_0656 [Lachnoanaerobaculum saburreum F0468]